MFPKLAEQGAAYVQTPAMLSTGTLMGKPVLYTQKRTQMACCKEAIACSRQKEDAEAQLILTVVLLLEIAQSRVLESDPAYFWPL
jgi:hypothetical protein